MKKYTRDYVEAKGKTYRQAPVEEGDWYLTSALGIPMYVRKDDESVTPSIIKYGYWESWVTTWMLNNVTDKLFIDIGANTGYYALLAANEGATVMAYEPNPQYVDMLRESIKIDFQYNRLHGDVNLMPEPHFNVYPYAVSDKTGTATLIIPQALQGSATIREVDLSAYNSRDLEVLTVDLDSQVGSLPPTDMLIKVDAEGAEEMIWDGAFMTRYRHKPVWMLEYTPGAYGRDFLTKLEDYCGELKWINHSGEEEPITKNQVITQTDWVMLAIRPKE